MLELGQENLPSTSLISSMKLRSTEAFDQPVYADLIESGVLVTGEAVLWRARTDDSKVDYSFVKKWDEGGYADGKINLFFFDVNKHERDDLRIQRARVQQDLANEQAEVDPDKGLITSYERMIPRLQSADILISN